MNRFPHVFVAGTFDGLHKGHIALLTRALEEGERVTVGVTSDSFIRAYKSQITNHNDQTKRKQAVVQWLTDQGFIDRAKIIFIDNPYEPAASMPDLTAIIVTAENRTTGERINELRQGLALSPVALIEVPIVAADDGQPISSSRIRGGEITAFGKLILPDSLRPELRRPLGRVLTGKAIDKALQPTAAITITVGDATTETALGLGSIPNLSIIDLHIARKIHDTLAKVPEILLYYSMAVESGPGYISSTAQTAIAAWATHCRPTLLIVKGEEDLLALPVVVHAPEGAIVYYGQPGEGVVEVVVSPVIKNTAKKLLKQFL